MASFLCGLDILLNDMENKPMSGGSETVGGIALVKLFPGLLGVAGGVVSFLFMPPKSRKEFATRLVSAAIGSHFFGDSALRVIVELFGRYVEKEEMRAGVYLLTGGIFFFIVGAVFLWISKRQGKDIQELIEDVKK
jgi:hypothetical protein